MDNIQSMTTRISSLSMDNVPPVPPPEKAKSYLVYDEYVLNQENGNRVVCVDESVSWNDFKKGNHIINKVSWRTNPDGVPSLPGQEDSKQYHLATDISRKASQSLIKKVVKIHSEGCCLESLSVQDIRVYPSGKVKLKGVRFLTRQDLNARDFNLLLRKNFETVSRIIRGLFSVPGCCIPPDIHQLLHLLNHHDISDRDIFPIHSSLAPLVSFSAIFKEFKDYLDAKVSDGDYHAICSAIIADFNGKDWRDEVFSNSLLFETYGFKNSDYEVPRNTPGQTQLTAAQRQALNEVGLVSSDPTGLTPFEESVIDGHKLLKFLRNRYAHRSEALEAGYNTWNREGHNFSIRSSEVVTRVKFGRVIGVIQFQIHRLRHWLMIAGLL